MAKVIGSSPIGGTKMGNGYARVYTSFAMMNNRRIRISYSPPKIFGSSKGRKKVFDTFNVGSIPTPNSMKTNDKLANFLVNRDETGREIVFFPETGKKYWVEYITPRHYTRWGDLNPATGKIEGNYGGKNTGTITESESLITKENGFNDIKTGGGSPYWTIQQMHEEWKKENYKKDI